MKTRRTILTLILFLAYISIIPLLFHEHNYVLHVFILCSQLGIVALTVRLMFTAGELSFGQVAFVMFGAYACGLLTKAGLSFWVAFPLAGVLTALFAGIIGIPVLRLRGTYFAILNLIIVEFMRQAAKNWNFVGGAAGLNDIPRPHALRIGTFTLIPAFTPYSKLPYFFLIGVLLIVTVVVFWRVEESPLGKVLHGIKYDTSLSESIGVNTLGYRILIYCMAAFFAGLSGAFYASYMTVFYPDTFSVIDSMYYVLYAFIGGIGYLLGPLLGAFGLRWLWEFLHPVEQWQMVVFSAFIVLTILFLPGGILSLEQLIAKKRLSSSAKPTKLRK